ncbi:MAG: quinone-dependent dihydroorotate dehydrogenase [Neisseriaceae bacterium]|nr:quinone-dependent dihydroorotate dehydrogenase [Neisseriaceae bacterium]
MTYHLLQKILFAMDAERSHIAALNGLKFLHRLHFDPFPTSIVKVPSSLMGLPIPNPIGLAAGLDKNGDYIDALSALGFGFIEIGTVTPKPQAGNPKPRLFRIPKHQAILNRMGFNNQGIDYLVNNVKKAKYDGILGINIGKNATTPIENATDDYLYCLDRAYNFASYITINISSPNTQNLRSLQGEYELNNLLSKLKKRQKELSERFEKYVPLAVKIAPDVDETQIISMSNAIRQHDIDGVIATNTTIDKSSLGEHKFSNENGGLSGRPLIEKSNTVLKLLTSHLNDNQQKTIPIIGVGGIMNGSDVVEKLNNGAQAVQLYTGLIYRGPQLVPESIIAAAQYLNNKRTA